MLEKRFVVAKVGYTKLVVPLEHGSAGDFLNLLKGAIVLEEHSMQSKLTGKYEWNLYTPGQVEITIEDLKVYTKEEIELHKNGKPEPSLPPGDVEELQSRRSTPASDDDGFDIPF